MERPHAGDQHLALEDAPRRGADHPGGHRHPAPRELGELVAAKIECGRVSLAESWFFELIDTARRWWWPEPPGRPVP
mgnify:CR=1 FL=1